MTQPEYDSAKAQFLALTFQFKNAIKPFIVLAAVLFGSIGALVALWVMGAPFGFMAFLLFISLVGVIVSHIIVLMTSSKRNTRKANRSSKQCWTQGSCG